MTENLPGVPGGPADEPERPADASPEQSQPESPAEAVSYPMPPTPPTGVPSGPVPVAQVPPSPWSPYGQQPTGLQPVASSQPSQQSGYHQGPQSAYGSGFQPPTGPVTSSFLFGSPPPEPPRQRRGGLIIGVAVLALVIGGLAGGLGGYLVSSQGNNAGLSSLEQPLPANQTANAPAGSVQSVANKVLPVVVTIAAEYQQQGNVSGDTGSGIIISTGGDILTNNHVIASAATNGGHIQVIFASGRTADATVVGRDPTTDIAVIRAKGVAGLPIAQLGRADNLVVGQEVVAIGAPFELSGTVTSGIVSSLHRPTAAGDSSDTSQTTVLDAIQTDAPINPGNSGGPLVDMQGQVIGINSAIYSPNSSAQSQGGNVGIGFAIPIDQARRTADEIVQTGFATQTVLGVKVEDNTPSSNGQASILPNGALISQVTAGGPADKAGLKPGAVVVKADGRLVSSSDGLVAAVHAAAPGQQMVLTLSTGSTVTVTLSGQTVHPN